MKIISIVLTCMLAIPQIASATRVDPDTGKQLDRKNTKDIDWYGVDKSNKREVKKNANTKVGNASYYAHAFHGRTTASGSKYNMNALTCAHKTLPFGTRVRVTNPSNGQTVTLTVNDRGPYHGNRVLDLSYAGAKAIGLVQSGVGKIHYEILK